MKLPPFKLEEIFEQYEHELDMLVIGASDASNLTVQELFDLCSCNVDISTIRLKYGDVRGEFQLRDVVAKSYESAQVTAEQVLITIGASEAIFIAVQVLVEAGDRVLVCDPAYQPLASIASAIGASVETYPYLETNHFTPQLESIVNRLRSSPAIKLLILNTPHNPTGQIFSQDSMSQLLKAAKGAGTTVLVDEVFHRIWLGSTVPVPSALTLDPGVLVIGSLSKVYGLSGLRIGWLAGPTKIINACRQMRHYTTIAPPLIVQDLGAIAVKNQDRCLERTRKIVGENYSYVKNWLKRHEQVFDWIEPQAGLVMLLKLKPQLDTDQFVRDLAREKKVFLIPCSTTFNMPEGYLRLGLGTDHEVLMAGLQKLSDFIAEKNFKSA